MILKICLTAAFVLIDSNVNSCKQAKGQSEPMRQQRATAYSRWGDKNAAFALSLSLNRLLLWAAGEVLHACQILHLIIYASSRKLWPGSQTERFYNPLQITLSTRIHFKLLCMFPIQSLMWICISNTCQFTSPATSAVSVLMPALRNALHLPSGTSDTQTPSRPPSSETHSSGWVIKCLHRNDFCDWDEFWKINQF